MSEQDMSLRKQRTPQMTELRSLWVDHRCRELPNENPCSEVVKEICAEFHRAIAAHDAEVVAEATLQLRREAKAEVLREAAAEWTQGEWAGATRYHNRVADRLASAQYAGDWLRDRADRMEAGE